MAVNSATRGRRKVPAPKWDERLGAWLQKIWPDVKVWSTDHAFILVAMFFGIIAMLSFFFAENWEQGAGFAVVAVVALLQHYKSLTDYGWMVAGIICVLIALSLGKEWLTLIPILLAVVFFTIQVGKGAEAAQLAGEGAFKVFSFVVKCFFFGYGFWSTYWCFLGLFVFIGVYTDNDELSEQLAILVGIMLIGAAVYFAKFHTPKTEEEKKAEKEAAAKKKMEAAEKELREWERKLKLLELEKGVNLKEFEVKLKEFEVGDFERGMKKMKRARKDLERGHITTADFQALYRKHFGIKQPSQQQNNKKKK